MSMTEEKRPVYPVFVVVPQIGSRLATTGALAEAVERVVASATVDADLHYRPSTDMALVALRLDARLASQDLISDLNDAVGDQGAAVLDASRLPEPARQRFFDDYLPQFDFRVHGVESFAQAIRVLGSQLAAGAGALLAAPPSSGGIIVPDRLEVRFRRGDRWQLARVRSLSKEGISVATGTPPRRSDLVDLELRAGDVSLLVRSSVVGVALGDPAQAIGATGFGARFIIAGETEERKLEELLALTADARALEPLPYRRDTRFPIRWPVLLRTPSLKAHLRALDVSRRGMFIGAERDVAPASASGAVHVTFPIDDRGTPILATARVARAVPSDLARCRGLSPGVGLELVALSSHDERRYAQFVGRIGRRAGREVIVGASASRVGDLLTALVAAGYCAIGVAAANDLVTRTLGGARVPDLVVIDSSLARENPKGTNAARRALALRQVATLSIDGDSPEAARQWVDGALLS
jgi:PilZ domain-containing protein